MLTLYHVQGSAQKYSIQKLQEENKVRYGAQSKSIWGRGRMMGERKLGEEGKCSQHSEFESSE